MLFLQSGDRLSTDMNSINIINTELAGSVTVARLTSRYFGATPPASTSFALPQPVPAFTVSQVGGAPVTTWQATGTIPGDYQGSTSVVQAMYTGAGAGTQYIINATRGWLAANGMGTNYTLSGPVLPGFLAAWAPPAPLADATISMFGSNLTALPTAGTVINVAIRTVQNP
jgi:hypothetical protein